MEKVKKAALSVLAALAIICLTVGFMFSLPTATAYADGTGSNVSTDTDTGTGSGEGTGEGTGENTETDPAPDEGTTEGVATIGETSYATLQAAIDAATSGQTVTLIKDVTENIKTATDDVITLDLNGNTISGTDYVVRNYGNLTINGEGTVALDTSVTNRNALRNEGGATLTINGGKYTTGNVQTLYNRGTLTITGGEFESAGSKKITAAFWSPGAVTISGDTKFTNTADGNGSIGIYGGSITIESGTFTNAGAQVLAISNSTLAEVTIKGGTFTSTTTGNASLLNVKCKTLNIEGGTFTAPNAQTTEIINYSTGDIAISGGSFDADIPEEYIDEDSVFYAVEGGYKAADFETAKAELPAEAVIAGNKAYASLEEAIAVGVVQVGDTYYPSLQNALDTTNNATIKLIGNVTADIVVPEDTTATLDLNGFTLKNVKDHTIINKGTLTIIDSAAAASDSPVEALAEETVGTVDNVTHGKAALYNLGTVTLLGGTFTRSAEAGTSPSSSGGNSWYVVKNSGVMTIGAEGEECSVKITSTGKFSSLIDNGYPNQDDYDYAMDNGGAGNPELTVWGGTFEGGLNTLKNDTFGSADIYGGEFSNTTQGVILNWTELYIAGGTFTASNDAEYAIITGDLPEGSTDPEPTTTITDGDFTGAISYYSNPAYPEYGTEPEYSISGGTFSATVPGDYIAANAMLVSDGENGYVVGDAQEIATEQQKDYYVANGIAYESLPAAVAAVPTDNKQVTITLVDGNDDAKLSGDGVKVQANQNIVIDFNGNTYDVSGATVGSTGTETNGFQLLKGSTVEMKNGTVTATSSTAKLLIQKYCDLTLRDMVVDGRGLVNDGANYVVSNNNGTTTFAGNTIVYADEGDYAFDVYYWPKNGYTEVKVVFADDFTGTIDGDIQYASDGSEGWFENASLEINGSGTFNGELDVMATEETALDANISISGGTFAQEVPADYLAEDALYYKDASGNFVFMDKETAEEEGYVITLNGYGYTSIDAAVAAGAEAYIDLAEGVDVAYETLDEALEAAKEGETVKLMADITSDATVLINKNVVLDLNRFTATSTASSSSYANFLYVENATNITIKNGTIVGAAGQNAIFAIASNLTLDNVTIDAGKANAVGIVFYGTTNISAIKGDGATTRTAVSTEGFYTLNVNNSTVQADVYGIAGNGGAENSGTIININNSTVETLTQGHGTAIFHPQYGILNVDGANTVIEGLTGIEMRAGELNVYDGTITSTLEEPLLTDPNPGEGNSVYGAAVAISQHTTQLPVDVNVSGGTLGATYEGNYALYEIDLIEGSGTGDKDIITISLTGGTYNGEVYSENKTGYITGGQYRDLPAEDAFLEGYAGELFNGYYVVVESGEAGDTADLLAMRLEAQTDVRLYAAALGFRWADVQDDAEIASAYAAINAATSTSAVALAKAQAMDAIDVYYNTIVDARAEAIEAIEQAAGSDVTVPTATYAAINGAMSAEEIAYYRENALAEIQAIRSLRTEITAQAGELEGIAAAVERLEDAFAGQDGEFDSLLGDIRAAISAAQEAIESGTSEALQDMQAALEAKIDAGTQAVKDAVSGVMEELTQLAESVAAGDKALQEAIAAGEKALAEQIEAVQGDIGALEGAVDGQASDLQASIDALESAVGEQASAVQADIDALRTAIAAAQADIDDILASIAAGGPSFEELAEQIAAIKSTADGLQTSVGDVQTAVKAAQDAVAAAQGALSGQIEEADDAASFTTLYVLVGIALALSAAAVALLVVLLLKRSKAA